MTNSKSIGLLSSPSTYEDQIYKVYGFESTVPSEKAPESNAVILVVSALPAEASYGKSSSSNSQDRPATSTYFAEVKVANSTVKTSFDRSNLPQTEEPRGIPC